MKKSVVVWIHVGFCCMYVLSKLSSVLFLRHMNITLYGQATVMNMFALPVLFYVSYFLTYLILKNKKNIVYALLFYLSHFMCLIF